VVVNVVCKHSRIKQYLKRRPGDAHRDRPYPRGLGCNTACPTSTSCKPTKLLADIILFQVADIAL
jgi:hypothetical protein